MTLCLYKRHFEFCDVIKVNQRLGIFASAILVMASLGAITTITITIQTEHAQDLSKKVRTSAKAFAPIAVSGNNVYVSWWSNKSGDWEIFFKASSDAGKTFGPTINLSNSPGVVSDNTSIAALGNNVYVSWWEEQSQSQNGTSSQPVLRTSADNGKTFGDKIILSNNADSIPR
jgi:hypothetical protein